MRDANAEPTTSLSAVVRAPAASSVHMGLVLSSKTVVSVPAWRARLRTKGVPTVGDGLGVDEILETDVSALLAHEHVRSLVERIRLVRAHASLSEDAQRGLRVKEANAIANSIAASLRAVEDGEANAAKAGGSGAEGALRSFESSRAASPAPPPTDFSAAYADALRRGSAVGSARDAAIDSVRKAFTGAIERSESLGVHLDIPATPLPGATTFSVNPATGSLYAPRGVAQPSADAQSDAALAAGSTPSMDFTRGASPAVDMGAGTGAVFSSSAPVPGPTRGPFAGDVVYAASATGAAEAFLSRVSALRGNLLGGLSTAPGGSSFLGQGMAPTATPTVGTSALVDVPSLASTPAAPGAWARVAIRTAPTPTSHAMEDALSLTAGIASSLSSSLPSAYSGGASAGLFASALLLGPGQGAQPGGAALAAALSGGLSAGSSGGSAHARGSAARAITALSGPGAAVSIQKQAEAATIAERSRAEMAASSAAAAAAAAASEAQWLSAQRAQRAAAEEEAQRAGALASALVRGASPGAREVKSRLGSRGVGGMPPSRGGAPGLSPFLAPLPSSRVGTAVAQSRPVSRVPTARGRVGVGVGAAGVGLPSAYGAGGARPSSRAPPHVKSAAGVSGGAEAPSSRAAVLEAEVAALRSALASSDGELAALQGLRDALRTNATARAAGHVVAPVLDDRQRVALDHLLRAKIGVSANAVSAFDKLAGGDGTSRPATRAVMSRGASRSRSPLKDAGSPLHASPPPSYRDFVPPSIAASAAAAVAARAAVPAPTSGRSVRSSVSPTPRVRAVSRAQARAQPPPARAPAPVPPAAVPVRRAPLSPEFYARLSAGAGPRGGAPRAVAVAQLKVPAKKKIGGGWGAPSGGAVAAVRSTRAAPAPATHRSVTATEPVAVASVNPRARTPLSDATRTRAQTPEKSSPSKSPIAKVGGASTPTTSRSVDRGAGSATRTPLRSTPGRSPLLQELPSGSPVIPDAPDSPYSAISVGGGVGFSARGSSRSNSASARRPRVAPKLEQLPASPPPVASVARVPSPSASSVGKRPSSADASMLPGRVSPERRLSTPVRPVSASSSLSPAAAVVNADELDVTRTSRPPSRLDGRASPTAEAVSAWELPHAQPGSLDSVRVEGTFSGGAAALPRLPDPPEIAVGLATLGEVAIETERRAPAESVELVPVSWAERTLQNEELVKAPVAGEGAALLTEPALLEPVAVTESSTIPFVEKPPTDVALTADVAVTEAVAVPESERATDTGDSPETGAPGATTVTESADTGDTHKTVPVAVVAEVAELPAGATSVVTVAESAVHEDKGAAVPLTEDKVAAVPLTEDEGAAVPLTEDKGAAVQLDSGSVEPEPQT